MAFHVACPITWLLLSQFFSPISISLSLCLSNFIFTFSLYILCFLSFFLCRRRICFCSLGFPRELHSDESKNEFLEEVSRVEDFLKDPWLLTVRSKATVQVAVPKVVAPPPPPVAVGLGDGDGEEMLSAQRKRAAMQRKAAAASLVAEDYARRFESGALVMKNGRSFFLQILLDLFRNYQLHWLLPLGQLWRKFPSHPFWCMWWILAIHWQSNRLML